MPTRKKEMNEYNQGLCEERHHTIDKAFGYFKDEIGKHDMRIKKVENRFLAIMTALVLNLLGVVGTLAVLLLRSKGG